MVENHAASGDPDGVFKNVFIRSLSNGRFRTFDHWALMWMDRRYDHPKSYGKKIKEK